jgi:CheY-like chemotaxis protein
MDYDMPIMNGLECTKILVSRMKKKEFPKIPIVALTAYFNEREHCLKVGMSDFSNYFFYNFSEKAYFRE